MKNIFMKAGKSHDCAFNLQHIVRGTNRLSICVIVISLYVIRRYRNNGILDGRVCVHYGTGDKFFGTFENNLRQDKGMYLYEDGAKYIGNFEKGVHHGRGAYTTPNSHKFDGKFVEGRFEGLGFHTFPDGRREFGIFQNGTW